jgi:hypothetical protein
MSSASHAAASASIEKQFGVKRSPLWDETRKKYLATNPKCAVCGDTASVEVHHMFPFHYVVKLGRPDLELDEENFVTLCEDKAHDHHLLVGHLDDWKSYDSPGIPPLPSQLNAFIAKYHNKSAIAIKADATFQQAHAGKPPHLDKMTAVQKSILRQLLDHQMPPKPGAIKAAEDARKGM